jgi:hypothetical protein
LDAFDGLSRVRAARDLEQVVRPDAAERHLEQLEPDGRDVGRCDEQALEPGAQAPRRKGQVDMQEDDGRQDVENQSDRVRHG